MIDWLSEYIHPEIVEKVNLRFDEALKSSKRDRVVMRRNLLDLSDHLDRFRVKHFLVFGTLLGAVREKDIIEGDHDVDIALHPDYRWDFAELLADGLDGWTPIRLWNDLVSLERDGEYVDIYFFGPQENFDKLRCLDYYLTVEEVEELSQIEFLGKKFLTVKDPVRYLEEKYGPDWRVPSNKCATS